MKVESKTWTGHPGPILVGESYVEFPVMAIGRYRHYAAELVGRVRDELGLKHCLVLSPRDCSYYDHDNPPFGLAVEAKFSRAAEDISEASKCIGLGRYTAAVFHIMRALESATQTIAVRLNAAVTDSSGKGLPWGVIADNMKPKIDAMTRGSDEQIKWYRVQQELVVVNRAWRVPTNHPKETYTSEQAYEVFEATKAFMKDLADLA